MALNNFIHTCFELHVIYKLLSGKKLFPFTMFTGKKNVCVYVYIYIDISIKTHIISIANIYMISDNHFEFDI